MNMCDLIQIKKNGEELSEEQIHQMIEGYTRGEIPDYQMSAFLMAVCFTGMSIQETTALTLAMAKSGEQMDLSSIQGKKVDKHSTGGVGDKVSLVLAPLVASVGIPVAKMAGRGLGHTGGTIDKLECFDGFQAGLTRDQFVRNVNALQIAIACQTADLAPADRKLYALRDVTGTVDQVSLIASSIMSKKLASGADGIVLDVKVGDGAFMKTLPEAKNLAEMMVAIGRAAGRDVTAVLSDMEQPLGYAIGNALEVKEAIETLKGNGPQDLVSLVLALGSIMAVKANVADTRQEGQRLLETALRDGKAFEKFCQFIQAQGGSPDQVLHPELLPGAAYKKEVCAERSGFISRIRAREMGRICLFLGGGRKTKESVIDPGVGLVLRHKTGEYVQAGESLAQVHANSRDALDEAIQRVRGAFEISEQKPDARELILGII